jgi:lipid A 4'-phosphatase
MPPVDPGPLALKLAVAALGTLLLFALWPRLDLGVSWIFFTPGAGFLAGEQAWFEAVRRAVWGLSIAMVLAALAGLAASWRLGRPVLRLTQADWGFIAALYALGPGLLVEAVLKRSWGRARPADVTDFGGTRRFTGATELADQCLRNCSFTAGEMSGAVALAVAAALILWRWRDRLSTGVRRAARILLIGQALLVGVQRIAAGRHFLSDVILSALFTLIVAAALALLLRPGEEDCGRGRGC